VQLAEAKLILDLACGAQKALYPSPNEVLLVPFGRDDVEAISHKQELTWYPSANCTRGTNQQF